MLQIVIDNANYDAEAGEHLIDVINRTGREIPQVCYHPQLGPIQTCDTCLVEVNGQLVRACGTAVSEGMQVVTKSMKSESARREAFRPYPGEPPSLLYGLRQQQRQLHCS
jgi:formate dehydrogenase major subunit